MSSAMRTGLASARLNGRGHIELVEASCACIAAAGFDAVEIFENDLLSFNGRPHDVAREARPLTMPRA